MVGQSINILNNIQPMEDRRSTKAPPIEIYFFLVQTIAS